MQSKNKASLLFWGAIISMILFAIVPPTYQLITFIIPLIFLCITLVNERDTFNFYLALIILAIFMFIPSNFLMMDSNLDTFWIFREDFITGYNIVTSVVFIGCPVLLIGFGIYALVATNVNSGLSALLKGLGILAILIAAFGILDAVGMLPEWGTPFWDIITKIWDFIVSFVTGIVNIIIALVDAISSFINQAISDSNLVSQGKLTIWGWIWNRIKGLVEEIWNFIKDDILSALTTKTNDLKEAVSNQTTAPIVIGCIASGGLACFDASNSQIYLINIARSYPIILSIFCIIMSCAFRFNSHFQQDINKLWKPTDDEFFFSFNAKYDFSILGQLLVTLVVSFFVYLAMNEGGFTDSTFFGLYLAVIISCTVVILFQLIPARSDTILNFLTGSILGGIGIFLMTNLTTSGRLDVLEANEITRQISQLFTVLTTIFYTAPAETLLFQIVLPGFALLLIYYLYKGRAEAKYSEMVQRKIDKKTIELAQIRAVYQHALDMNRKSRKLDNMRIEIFNLDNEIADLKERQLTKVKKVELFTLMSASAGALTLTILFVFLVPSFLFAALHVAKSGISLFEYFNFGPGFLIMSVSCWIIFIGLRFGYNSAMTAHSFNNLFIILLVRGIL